MRKLLLAAVLPLILICINCPATVPVINDSVLNNALGLEAETANNLPTVAAIAATANTGGATGAEINVNVSGTNYLTGSTYSFAGVGASTQIPFTIQNLGGSTLNLTSVSLGGVNPTWYTLVQPGSMTIAPGGSTTALINNWQGVGTTILIIQSNDGDESTYQINTLGCGC